MSLKIEKDDELEKFLKGSIIQRFFLKLVTCERINSKMFEYEKRFLKNKSYVVQLDCEQYLVKTNLDRHRDVIFKVLNMVFNKLEIICCFQSFNADRPGESVESLRELLNIIFASNQSLADVRECNNVRNIKYNLTTTYYVVKIVQLILEKKIFMIYLKEFRKLIISRFEETASKKLRKEQILQKVESNFQIYKLAAESLNAKWMENKSNFTHKLIPKKEKIEKFQKETAAMKNEIERKINESL